MTTAATTASHCIACMTKGRGTERPAGRPAGDCEEKESANFSAPLLTFHHDNDGRGRQAVYSLRVV